MPVRALLLLALAATLASCASPYRRETLHDDGLVKVVLRTRVAGGEPVARGFSQPRAISGVRLAHILSQLDVRMRASDEGGGERRPAIHTELVFSLGDHLSAAFAKAGPDQEVVVTAVRKERRLGVFTQDYLTSFTAWVDGEDRLQIHLARCDWQVPKGDEEEIEREPVPGAGPGRQRFRVIPAQDIDPIGSQSVAIQWSAARFRRDSTLSVGAAGRVQRRRVLMESPVPVEEEAVAEEAPLPLPSDPDTLRALADLEEERRAGRLPEAEYLRLRRELLEEAARR